MFSLSLPSTREILEQLPTTSLEDNTPKSSPLSCVICGNGGAELIEMKKHGNPTSLTQALVCSYCWSFVRVEFDRMIDRLRLHKARGGTL